MLARRTGVSYKEMLALVRRGAIVARCAHGRYHIEASYARRIVPLLRVRRMLQESDRKRGRALVSVRGVATRVGVAHDFISGLVRRGALNLTRIGDLEGFEVSYLNRVLPLLRTMALLYRQQSLERRREKLRERREALRKNIHRKVPRATPGEHPRVNVAA